MPAVAEVGVPAMSLVAACVWTLLRSALVTLLGLPVCCGLSRSLRAAQGFRRLLGWSCLAAPFLFPALLTGYAYRGFSLSLMQTTSWCVRLFDAQAGGLILGESLRLGLWPLFAEVVILAPLLLLAMKAMRLPPSIEASRCGLSQNANRLVAYYLLAAVIAV